MSNGLGSLGPEKYIPFKTIFLILFILLMFLCCGPASMPFPHTERYHPCSPWEIEEYKKANLNVFPDDVRQDFSFYKDTVIAWPGIIQSYDLTFFDDHIDVDLLLKHHYYDWLEDYGYQKEKIFLSPQGEGLFSTIWRLRRDIKTKELHQMLKNYNLAIVYGYPDSIGLDSTIAIKSTYIRGLPRDSYRTDKMDYDRVYHTGEKYLQIQSDKFPLREMCCLGGGLVVAFGGLASLSFLSFGDEILGGYWACSAIATGAHTFNKNIPGRVMMIPLALGLGALSYYDFAYGDDQSRTKVFFVNAISPPAIVVFAVIGGIVFSPYPDRKSDKVNFRMQPNGINISMRF